jgi:hypothetical protein
VSVADDLAPLISLGRDLGASDKYVGQVNKAAGKKIRALGIRRVKAAIGNDMIMRNYPRRGRPQRATVDVELSRGELDVAFRPRGMFGLLQGPHPPTRFPVRETESKAVPIWLKENTRLLRARLR